MNYFMNVVALNDTVTLRMEAVGHFETLVLSIKLQGENNPADAIF
jgi:hypothetical protein